MTSNWAPSAVVFVRNNFFQNMYFSRWRVLKSNKLLWSWHFDLLHMETNRGLGSRHVKAPPPNLSNTRSKSQRLKRLFVLVLCFFLLFFLSFCMLVWVILVTHFFFLLIFLLFCIYFYFFFLNYLFLCSCFPTTITKKPETLWAPGPCTHQARSVVLPQSYCTFSILYEKSNLHYYYFS